MNRKTSIKRLKHGDTFTFDGTHCYAGYAFYFLQRSGPFFYCKWKKYGQTHEISLDIDNKNFFRLDKSKIAEENKIDEFHK